MNSHLNFENQERPVLTVPCISELNIILSMPRSQKCSFFLSQTEFFIVILPPFHCYIANICEDIKL